MRFVYGHFLSENESLKEFMNSRSETRPRIRHVVRNSVYNRYECTLNEISRAEQKIKGIKPHHTTIIHSMKIVRSESLNYKTFRIVDQLIDEFELYNEYMNDSVFTQRLSKHLNTKHHVLAVMLSIAENSGYADSEYLDQLKLQFSSISPAFVRQKINKVT